MQKLINVLSVTSFVLSASIASTGAYLYLNKDALIEQAKAAAVDEIKALLPTPELPGLDTPSFSPF